MTYKVDIDKLVDDFNNKGFCHVDLLDHNEAIEFSKLIDKEYDLAITEKRNLLTGLNNFEEFWTLISDERILEIVRSLLKEKIYYLYHSAIMKTKEDKHYQHHRDNPFRKFGAGEDWDEKKEKYKIIRVGIYLNTYEETKFSLNLIPNSHKNNISWREALRFMHKKIKRYGINDKYINFLPKIFGQGIKANAGTCIFFDPRVYHSPSPHKNSRRAIFLSFGNQSAHSKNYVDYFSKTRSKDHEGLDFEKLSSQSKFKEFLLKKDLYFPLK